MRSGAKGRREYGAERRVWEGTDEEKERRRADERAIKPAPEFRIGHLIFAFRPQVGGQFAVLHRSRAPFLLSRVQISRSFAEEGAKRGKR